MTPYVLVFVVSHAGSLASLGPDDDQTTSPSVNDPQAVPLPSPSPSRSSPTDASAPPSAPSTKPEEPAASPAPYSVPWQLRPVVAPTVVRVDTSVARYDDVPSGGPSGGSDGLTTATVFTGSYRIAGTGPPSAGLAPLFRVAVVRDVVAGGGEAVAVSNPLIGLAYAVKIGGDVRANFFFGATLPEGTGSGRVGDNKARTTQTKGANTRARFDNALFATNDVTLIPGLAAAWVRSGFTVQLEATLFHLVRSGGAGVQPEATKTNFTTGMHAGYFVTSFLSFGSEIRYQRWLNAPFAVEREKGGASADTCVIALGPRAHFPVGQSLFLRPGIAYHRALDAPLAGAPSYQIVQIDVPLFFM